MGKLLPRSVAILLALAVCACAAPPPIASSPAASEFRSNVAAPSGLARVYVLPTLSKGMFTDPEGRAGIGIFNDGSDKGAPLAWTAKSVFVAFDLPPGTYSLMAYTDGTFTKFSTSMTFDAGTVYFLRPTFFASAKDVAAAGGVKSPGMHFEALTVAAGSREIQGMEMAALRPEGQAFLAQAGARSAPPQAPYATSTQVQPAVQAAPATHPAQPAPAAMPAQATPEAAPFAVIERKLKDLRRLRQEGLITKEEYESKRRAVLDAY